MPAFYECRVINYLIPMMIVPAKAPSLTLTPPVGTGEQNTACFNLVLTN